MSEPEFKPKPRKHNFKDLTGLVVGRLTVLSEAPKREGEKSTRWVCTCACGATTVVHSGNLSTRTTKSCGCLNNEKRKVSSVSHGMSGTSEYQSWSAMWSRTTNPNNKAYPRYSKRMPPDEWRDFTTFLRSVGQKPSPQHSLERIDNNMPYGPGNCRWALPSEQNVNKSNNRNVVLVSSGDMVTLSEACSQFGLNYWTVASRLNKYGYTTLAASGGLFDSTD